MPPQTKPQTKRSGVRSPARSQLSSGRSLPAPTPLPTVAIEGRVRRVDEDGSVHAVLDDGTSIRARCPSHLDARWLRAAARIAPVDAVFFPARPSGRYVLWGIFPDNVHAEVAVDVLI